MSSPFCLHKAKTLIQCKIHIRQDHKIISNKDVHDTLQLQICDFDESERNNNFSQDDLKELLKMIETNSDDSQSMIGSYSNETKCTRCGFTAKNNRGLKIHLHTCNKRSQTTQNVQQSSNETLIERLMSLRSQRRIMNRIPKGARKTICEEYTKTIFKCITDKENSENSWDKLFTFAYNTLQLPPKNEKRKCSLATIIRRNILNPENSSINMTMTKENTIKKSSRTVCN